MPRHGFDRLVVVVGLLCVSGLVHASAKEEPDARSSVEGAFALVAAGPTYLVVDWDPEAIRSASSRPGLQRLRAFPLATGRLVDLEVERFFVTSERTQIVRGQKGAPDLPLDFDPRKIAFFRGRVLDYPGSHVFLAFSQGHSTGEVDLGAGQARYRLASRGHDEVELESGSVAVFEIGPPSARPPGVPECGTLAVANPATPLPLRGSSTPQRGLRLLELAVDTDHELFALFGESTAALTYLTMLYAQLSDIYQRDLQTRVELSFVRIWDNPDDLFNDVDPSPLADFRDHWNSNMGAVQRDAAQLLSGRRDYPFGGQAYLSAVCGFNAYSVVGYAMGFFPDPSRPSPYHYDISVTAHELGHNSGTGHTHDSPNFVDDCANPASAPQRGTIMSYCSQTWSGGNAVRDLYFHATIRQNIDAYLSGANCVVADCNVNGVDDDDDIQQSTSLDVNGNGVPDECEDCNENTVLDGLDIAGLTSLDLNSNAIPDECEPDCNLNTIPDDKDLADGTSFDLHGNAIPDECEADCDANMLADYAEIQNDMTLDINRNAVLDACEDCDGDLFSDLEELGGAHFAWVASGSSGSYLRRFHSSVGVLSAVSTGGAGALVDEAYDLIVAPNGSVLVTSHADHRVLEFDLDGNYLGDLVAPVVGGLSGPTGLTVTPDDLTLLVANSGTHEVLAYDLATGTGLGAFVASGAGGLVAPAGLTFGPTGNLFVTSASNEVLEFDATSGAFVRVFVTTADNGGLDQPRGLAFKRDGNLIVASFGTDQVLEYDRLSGAALGAWAHVGTATVLTQTSPWGVRVGPNGNVFVSRTGDDNGSGGGHADLHLSNAQIYEFDAATGNFLRTYVAGNDHGLVFPTGFDFVPGWQVDCNVSFLPDECDLIAGTSVDLDFDTIPDECELDCNANGVGDHLDLIPTGVALDCNRNTVPDGCELAAGTSFDCTVNGLLDECEPDCNANGGADSCDIQSGFSYDCNGDGRPDDCDVTDDFEVDTGWIAGVLSDTADPSGVWTRVDPNGTSAQPEDDHSGGTGTTCFVTGQGAIGGNDNKNDVDDGITTLVSPSYDLAGSSEARISYWRWFSNDLDDNPAEDTLVVDVSNDDGQSWTNVEVVGPLTQSSGGWIQHAFRVADFVAPSAQVRVRFVVGDLAGSSLVEAAIDELTIVTECCTTNNAADVADLKLEGGAGKPLRWLSQGPGMIYDVVSGDLTVLRASTTLDDALCVADEWPVSNWTDPRPDPAPTQVYYYLVRSDNSCLPSAAGGFGSDSSGTPRSVQNGCP